MTDIKLKYYKQYMKRLERYIQANGLKLVYSQEEESDAIIFSKNTIRIAWKQSEAEEVASILHELGHFLDFLVMTAEQIRKVDKSYAIHHKAKKSTYHRNIVCQYEKRAWDNGRAIAGILKIRLGRWYDEVEAECLKSYKDYTNG